MKHLIKVLFICFTSFAISVSIDSGAIFVHSSDKELTDAEVKKLTDDYYAEREKSRKNVAVTYKKEKLKNGVVYHYTVKNGGEDSIGRIDIGNDNYNIHDINPNKREAVGCEVPTDDITNIKVNKPNWVANLETQEENENDCLVIDSPKNDQEIKQNQSITISVYLKKDDPKFANLHWYVIFWGTDNLSGIVKKAK